MINTHELSRKPPLTPDCKRINKVLYLQGFGSGGSVLGMSFREAAITFEMVQRSGTGREFAARRRVRLGDATPNGRLRLDAIARYLQDVSNDDTRSADWSDPHWWVVRRTVLDVHTFPAYLSEIDLVTWCGGIGTHWAERRTQIRSLDGEPLVDAASLWVHVDQTTLQPSRVPDGDAELLRASANGREVGARLLLKPKAFVSDAAVTAAVAPWPMRFADFDALGHMNNAAYWVILEEQLATDRGLCAPMRAIIEHAVQVEPGQVVERKIIATPGDIAVQLCSDSTVHASAWCGTNP